jgi:hypothetical protein
MAGAIQGLPLPMEVVIKIVQHCEEYDWLDDPEAMFMGEQDNPHWYTGDNENRGTWKTATKSTKQDIRNVRLVCRQLKTGSLESFGAILGERIFRLTKIDLEDLFDIGKTAELLPWIKTLTFGTAQLCQGVHDSVNFTTLQEHVDEHCQSAQPFGTIEEAHTKCVAYEQSREPERDLTRVLPAFRNLENLRVVVVDKPDHHGGWLTPEQKEFPGSYYIICSTDIDLTFLRHMRPERLYTSRRRHSIIAILFKAFGEAEILIKDMKFPMEGTQSTVEVTSFLHPQHAPHYTGAREFR